MLFFHIKICVLYLYILSKCQTFETERKKLCAVILSDEENPSFDRVINTIQTLKGFVLSFYHSTKELCYL